jgi:hypothetical protein
MCSHRLFDPALALRLALDGRVMAIGSVLARDGVARAAEASVGLLSLFLFTLPLCLALLLVVRSVVLRPIFRTGLLAFRRNDFIRRVRRTRASIAI